MKIIQKDSFNFDERPFLVIWETTRACDLACVHCRAAAEPHRTPDELNYVEGMELIDEVHEMGTPILIFSGGDCLKREDLPQLISYAKSLRIRTGAIPAITPDLTADHLIRLRQAGLDQIAFSLDAANAEDHDAFRATPGVYDRTLASVRQAHELGLRVQINSLINVHNEEQLDGLIQLMDSFPLVFWEVFFLVPTGRGETLPVMSGDKFEEAFEKIYKFQKKVDFTIKVTEAPHYRRYCHEQGHWPQSVPAAPHGNAGRMPDDFRRANAPARRIGRAPNGVNSGKGFTFISYCGDIMPSGFLPIAAGNVRRNSLADVYRNAPVFKELRNTELLKGRCGQCEYKEICGGSRARAYAMTGDYLAEDPCCAYVPEAFSAQAVSDAKEYR